MSLALQKDQFADALAADNDNKVSTLEHGNLSPEAKQAVRNMVQFCERNSVAAHFLAHGLVIDTMGDIAKQVRDCFPERIDVTPIIDDVSVFVAERAQNTQQRFQEVMLTYITDGQTPKIDEANKSVGYKIYSPDGTTMSGGKYDDKAAVLKKDGGSGTGGGGAELTKLLQAGNKKFFLLTSTSLDITDARVQDLGIMQAFGGDPAAVTAALETMAEGGSPAKQIESVIEAVVEIKTLRQQLLNARDTPQAPVLAAALAIKTQALAVTLPNLQTVLPPAATKEITRHINNVKADMGAQHFAHAIDVLATSLPANNKIAAELIRAIETVQTATTAQGLTIVEAIALVIAKAPTLDASVSKLILELTAMIAKPEVMSTIERSLPRQIAEVIRADLIAPPLALAASIPIQPQTVVQSLQTMAKQTPSMTALAETVAKFEAILPKADAKSIVPPTQALQEIAVEIKAMSLSQNATPEVKAELKILAPVVEAMVVQSRTPVVDAAVIPQQQTQVIKETAQMVADTAKTTFHPSIAQMAIALQTTPSQATLQNVVANLQAMILSENTPVSVKAEITQMLAQAQTNAKTKGEDIYGDPYAARKPQPLSPYAPLNTILDGTEFKAPKFIAPSPWVFGADTGGYAIQFGNYPNLSPWATKADFNAARSNFGNFDFSTTAPKAANQNQGKGCCSSPFNCESCGLNRVKIDAIKQDFANSKYYKSFGYA